MQDLRQKFLPPEEVEKRESKILERIMEERNRLDREAELEAERERNAWEEQGQCFLFFVSHCEFQNAGLVKRRRRSD